MCPRANKRLHQPRSAAPSSQVSRNVLRIDAKQNQARNFNATEPTGTCISPSTQEVILRTARVSLPIWCPTLHKSGEFSLLGD